MWCIIRAKDLTEGTSLNAHSISVPLKGQGGTYAVPVLLNNSLALDFIVDSGAAYVSIPKNVVMTLIRMGILRTTEFVGETALKIADGSTMRSEIFHIRSLKVGNKIVENVTFIVAPVGADLLLGQSFLNRVKSVSIDNNTHVLKLE